jgi:hypothetical protein
MPALVAGAAEGRGMYRPGRFPDPDDIRRPPDTSPAHRDSENRGGLLTNLTLSIGRLILKGKLEIQRVGAAGSEPAHRHTRPLLRDRLRWRPRFGISATWPASRPGFQDVSHQSQEDRVMAERDPGHLVGENCTVILSDVVGFGADTRNDEDRRIIREALFSMTHTVLQSLPDVWSWDDRGDGLLTVVPPSVPTAVVVAHLHKELPAALEEHNQVYPASARIQLRVAIDVGPVVSDAMGVSGEAIIVTARLIEAPLMKNAMGKGGPSLGIIASPFIYKSVIRHGPYVEGYSEVRVDVKESSIVAWMKLFDILL